MTRKPRTLSSEENALWKRVRSTVKPLKPLPPEREDEIAAQVPAEPVAPKRKAAAPKTTVEPKLSPKKAAPAPPQKRDAEKRVRRGKLEIDASLDLHGHTQDSGRAALISFLRASYARGHRTVIVVTGKGRNMKEGAGEGVLKKRFADWLAIAELKPLLAGYAQAHRDHGGAGAFYVFLKRKT